MKTPTKYFSLLLAAIGFLTPVFAQHGDHRGEGNHNSGNSNNSSSNSNHQSYSPRQNNSVSEGQHNFSSNRQEHPNNFNRTEPNSQLQNRGGGYPSSSYSRNHFSENNNSYTDRSNRVGNQTNSSRSNNTLRGNNIDRHGNNDRYGYGNRGGYGYPSRYSYSPRRYEYSGFRHYSVLPRTWININFGGYPYYYNSGLFYSYYDGFYEPVYAPFGIHVSILPFGYYPFYIGPSRYYYYEGSYYRNYGESEYEVIDAPMGAVIRELPKGATVATVNGEKFYEFNGTYYKEGVNNKNEVVYTVVGKYGEINNSDDQGNVSSNQSLQMGDIVTTLPLNSRQVTIDGQTLFVSPDNTYFKQRVVDGATGYEVVGTGINN